DRRAEIAVRSLLFDEGPSESLEVFERETDLIRRAVEDSRARLPKVRISQQMIRELSRSAVELGVRGNRADIFALRAAVASAALSGRTSVQDEDLLVAIKLVFMPRATSLPDTSERDEREGVREGKSRPDRDEAGSASNGDETGSGSGFRDLILKPVESPGRLVLPSYLLRRSSRPASGRRVPSPSMTGGRYVSSTSSRRSSARIAIDATLREAALHQADRKRMMPGRRATSNDARPIIKADDLRYKVLKRRSGALIIFAVDASGSMAVNRVAQAKGAMTRLLEKAYLHRDRVAFISFRGDEAKVLLQPTRSVVLGKRLVDTLPAGGATPLAKGLIAALDLARRARLQEKTESLLLIFTDGRANVGLRTAHLTDRVEREAAIEEELKRIGAAMRFECVHPVVIDTRSRYVSSGECRRLAGWLGARYLYLPRADAGTISDAVAGLSGILRKRGSDAG
ncbi:MAG TPA: VWA domain-containing protein, partial [Blastocatellia bacterium]|nr:VWA domain-containing protein [Blastocatellia bacterium]